MCRRSLCSRLNRSCRRRSNTSGCASFPRLCVASLSLSKIIHCSHTSTTLCTLMQHLAKFAETDTPPFKRVKYRFTPMCASFRSNLIFFSTIEFEIFIIILFVCISFPLFNIFKLLHEHTRSSCPVERLKSIILG